jgi:hypothetical protein
MILVVFSNINSLYLPKRSIRTFDSQACEESLSSFRQVRVRKSIAPKRNYVLTSTAYIEIDTSHLHTRPRQ